MRKILTVLCLAATMVAAAQSLLPMPEWTDKPAVLKGQIVGYADSMNLKVEVHPRMVYDADVPKVRAEIDADGTFEMEVPMYATHEGMFGTIGPWYGIVVLSAGETTEVKLNLTELLKTYPKEKVMENKMPDVEHPLQFSGAMAELNNEISSGKGREVIWHSYFNVNGDKRNMSILPEELYKDVIAHRDRNFAWIDSLDFTPQAKEFLKLTTRVDAMKLLLDPYPYGFVSTNRVGKEYFQRVIDPSLNSLMPAYCGNQSSISSHIRFIFGNDSVAMKKFIDEMPDSIPNEIFDAKRDSLGMAYVYELLGGSNGVIQDGLRGEYYTFLLETETPFYKSELAMLNAEENKFMREHFIKRNNALIAELERRKNDATYYTINKTATNTGDEFLSEISKNFEGKVVLIDLWGTWCGPCRNAIKLMKEHHDALAKKGVVFVYVTDTKSREEEWQNMASGMQGEHYRLSDKQAKEIFAKFNFGGWPSYIVIDKTGRYVYTKTGYLEEEMLKAINEAAK